VVPMTGRMAKASDPNDWWKFSLLNNILRPLKIRKNKQGTTRKRVTAVMLPAMSRIKTPNVTI